MGSQFGKIFSIATWGESHGKGIGVVIDGCPPGVAIDEAFIGSELARRRPGQSAIVTQRDESDAFEIQSGVFEGQSTGTPIAIWIPNQDQRSKDYSHIADKYRPSHADYTYDAKYGIRDYRGGGRSSARETAARVTAGAVAKLLLKAHGISIMAHVSAVGEIHSSGRADLDYSTIEHNPVRTASPSAAIEMEALIRQVRKEGDTIGGVVSGIIKGLPAGLGEPVFDKLHADLGKAMLSINAVKGFEYGSGFSGSRMRGSQHNDAFMKHQDGSIVTKTNHSGGIQGGISNGMDIDFRVAFKPVATIVQAQQSLDRTGAATTVEGKGRHDPCVVPRAVPIVEAMAALVIADHWLRAKVYKRS